MNTTLAPASVPTAVPVEPTTPIKPSEALRLGRLTYPNPHAGKWFGPRGVACALGAMAAGYGHVRNDGVAGLALLDSGLRQETSCPVCASPNWAYGVVWHLNDIHEWSDDQIVAWLESLGL